MTKEYTINAAGKKLGRISSEIAKILMGKTSVQFQNHVVAPVTVHVENASKMDMTEKKRTQEVRKRYSGYPGGQKVEKLGEYISRKNSGHAIKLAVKRMLPNNRLLTARLKNLIITE